MTAGNPEVMQAASNLHDQVRNAFLGEAQNIFDEATAFDAGDNVLDLNARRRENPIEEFITDAQRLAFRFFFGCRVIIPCGS